MSTLDYGISLPSGGPNATPENLVKLARRAEELGFAYLGVPDHVVYPASIDSPYPYSADGRFGGVGSILDQLTLIAYIAGVTSKARLLTSVMVLPHRSAVLTAKMLASIDVLSGGRLTVGCGVGWMREEFEALEAPPFDMRGAVGNEYIAAFKELWTNEQPSFKGDYVSFSNIVFGPKPLQKPHPPIWIGGESPAALRRAARLGDGWYPIASNPTYPVATAAQFSDAVGRLRGYAEDAGRDPAEIDLAYSVGAIDTRGERQLANGERRPFTGTPSRIAEDIGEFGALGVRHMMVGFRGRALEETLDGMEQFSSDIAPQVQEGR